MKKYYFMAIENNNINAIRCSAAYYRYTEKNYNIMIKYYLMGIYKNDIHCVINLFDYLKINNEKYNELRKYVIDCINLFVKKNVSSSSEEWKKFICIISSFHFNDNDDLLNIVKILISVVNTKMRKIELHFDYSMEGKGYNDAKSDFINKIIK